MTADSALRPAPVTSPGAAPDGRGADSTFALTFDSEAVHLMERESDGWSWRGTARFDAPDLSGRMAALRRLLPSQAADRVALIIPDDQILYTTLEVEPGLPRAEAVRRAMDGLTPYAMDDLVLDWREEAPARMKVAAVWRQTLAEAEAFAARNGFAPTVLLADTEARELRGGVRFAMVDPDEAGAVLPGEDGAHLAAELARARPELEARGDEAPEHACEGTAPSLDGRNAPDTSAMANDVAEGAEAMARTKPDAEGEGAVGDGAPAAAARPGHAGGMAGPADRDAKADAVAEAAADEAAEREETGADGGEALAEGGLAASIARIRALSRRTGSAEASLAAEASAPAEAPPPAGAESEGEGPAHRDGEDALHGEAGQAAVAEDGDAAPAVTEPKSSRAEVEEAEEAEEAEGADPTPSVKPQPSRPAEPLADAPPAVVAPPVAAEGEGATEALSVTAVPPATPRQGGIPVEAARKAATTSAAGATAAAPASGQPRNGGLDPAPARRAAMRPRGHGGLGVMLALLAVGLLAVLLLGGGEDDAAVPLAAATDTVTPVAPDASEAAAAQPMPADPVAPATTAEAWLPDTAAVQTAQAAPAPQPAAAPPAAETQPVVPEEEAAAQDPLAAMPPVEAPPVAQTFTPPVVSVTPAETTAAPLPVPAPAPAAVPDQPDAEPAAPAASLPAPAAGLPEASDPSDDMPVAAAPASRLPAADAPAIAVPPAPSAEAPQTSAPPVARPSAIESAVAEAVAETTVPPAASGGEVAPTEAAAPSPRPAPRPARPEAEAPAPAAAPATTAPAPRPAVAPPSPAEAAAAETAAPVSSARPQPRPRAQLQQGASLDRAVESPPQQMPRVRVALAGDVAPLLDALHLFDGLPESTVRGAIRVHGPSEAALFQAGEALPRSAQMRPPRREAPPDRSDAVEAALGAAVGGVGAAAAEPGPMRASLRPQRRPDAAASALPPGGLLSAEAVEGAIAAAIESSPAPPGGVALTALRSSPLPPRAPSRGVSDSAAGNAPADAIAAIVAATPVPAAPPPAVDNAAVEAQAAAAVERRRLDDELQAAVEARIRARAAADAKVEAEQRAAAEARARAQAAAEARAAAARRQPVRPVELDNEPELAALPRSGGTTSAAVATNATYSRGMDLNRTTLIGVIGAGPASRGLIRLRNGRVVTVRLGDRIDGGTITAIGEGRVAYVKGSRAHELRILDGR